MTLLALTLTLALTGADDATIATRVAFDDAHLLVATSAGTLERRAETTTAVSLHEGAITQLAFSRTLIATAGEDGIVRVLDRKTLEPRVRLEQPARALGFSADGATLRVVGPKGELLSFDASTGEARGSRPCPDKRVFKAAWYLGDRVLQAYADG